MERQRIKTYRDLIVWQKAISFVTEIYEVTKRFPKEETYGLSQQVRRCAVSIPSNIAEGYGRNSTKDFLRFLEIALGSLYELQTQIEIAGNLRYVDGGIYKEIVDKNREIERMLSSLIRKLKE